MRRTLTPRRPGRLLATIAAAALITTPTGCGLSDPMQDTQPAAATAAAATTTAAAAAAAPASADAARSAALRFADAYVDLLNDGGARAEKALHAAAAADLADGLVMASQDAQLAGDASATSSTRLLTIAPAAGAHWRAMFATGRTRWAMLLGVGTTPAGTVVTAASTQPAE